MEVRTPIGASRIFTGCYTTDALLHAPDVMFEQLALVFRSWITHGKITPSLLACSFLPLLKSSLKDPANTGSYRAIAGSFLLRSYRH